MTWLYVPSASALASEGSTSASALLDPTRAASLSWRGKLQQPQAWWRAWKRGGFIRLLSGLTCEPSTLEHGAAQWIASCRATPARETVSPESASAPMMTDGCSTAPSTSSIKAGLLLSSAKTFRGTSPDNSHSPSHHWSDWAAALRAEFSARLRPEQATDASGSSSWPTVSARDGDPRRAPTKPDSLAWANKVARGTVTASGMLSDDLSSSVVAWQPAQWPTPRTTDEKGGERQIGRERADGTKIAPQLAEVASSFRCSPPVQPIPAGQQSSPQRRRLNPLFVEWLMGWPEGLSGFDTAGMASCHSPQPSPGCGCMDCWLTKQRAMLSDLLTIDPPAQGLLL